MRLTIRLIFSTMAVITLLASPAAVIGASKILSNVPVYVWWHGCAPTAGGMIIAYWDAQGYSNLYSGDEQSYDSGTKAMIMSDDHVNQTGGHDTDGCSGVADSIGCYMHTDPATGSTSSQWLGQGLEDYGASKGYSNFEATEERIPDEGGSWTFSDFRAEIDAGRPVEMLMLRYESGSTYGHAITAYGYETSGGNYMVVHDTWGNQFGQAVDYYGSSSDEPDGYQDSGREYWEWVDWTGSNSTYSVYGGFTFTDGVPEPSLLALFITGLFILILGRKRSSEPAAERMRARAASSRP